MSTKQLDRTIVESISRDAMEALEAVAAKYGVQVRGGSGRFDSLHFTKKIEFFIASNEVGTPAEPTVAAHHVKNFEFYASMYGLEPAWLNTTFKAQGETFRIVGLDTKKPKNCIMLIRLSDKSRRICPPDFVKHNYAR